jgi:hypothetical protein
MFVHLYEEVYGVFPRDRKMGEVLAGLSYAINGYYCTGFNSAHTFQCN